MKKKTGPVVCGWCGTRLRRPGQCSRGPQCSREQRESEALEKRVAKQDPTFFPALKKARKPKPEKKREKEAA